MADIGFALVLNLHQPPATSSTCSTQREWQAKEILWAIDRIPRSLWQYEDVGRVHLSLSGTLLETLASPDFQTSRLRHRRLRVAAVVSAERPHHRGPRHRLLPSRPAADPSGRLGRAAGALAGARPATSSRATSFPGFWPPGAGLLHGARSPPSSRHGYRYVIVDSEHVEPSRPMSWDELRYRPHLAHFGGEQIVVVVRDRDLSNAQESGMEAGWFISEVTAAHPGLRLPAARHDRHRRRERRVVSQHDTRQQLLEQLHRDLMERVRDGRGRRHPPDASSPTTSTATAPHGWVTVRAGRVEHRLARRRRLRPMDRLAGPAAGPHPAGELSQAVHAARRNAIGIGESNPICTTTSSTLARVLRAETSCNFFWGEAWVQRCHDDLDQATRHLEQAGSRLT